MFRELKTNNHQPNSQVLNVIERLTVIPKSTFAMAPEALQVHTVSSTEICVFVVSNIDKLFWDLYVLFKKHSIQFNNANLNNPECLSNLQWSYNGHHDKHSPWILSGYSIVQHWTLWWTDTSASLNSLKGLGAIHFQ